MSLLPVVLLIVFGPFAFFIGRMLRFTRNTVGQNPPRVVRRGLSVAVRKYLAVF